MNIFLPTIILRHRKENLNKCSLRGLEQRSDLRFFTYPKERLPALDDYLLLGFEGPTLSAQDHNQGIILLDGTWRYALLMYNNTPQLHSLKQRSLPDSLKTAYPRRQEDCLEKERGLASVEALFAAYFFMGRDPKGLLDHYHWKEQFLSLNRFDNIHSTPLSLMN